MHTMNLSEFTHSPKHLSTAINVILNTCSCPELCLVYFLYLAVLTVRTWKLVIETYSKWCSSLFNIRYHRANVVVDFKTWIQKKSRKSSKLQIANKHLPIVNYSLHYTLHIVCIANMCHGHTVNLTSETQTTSTLHTCLKMSFFTHKTGYNSRSGKHTLIAHWPEKH